MRYQLERRDEQGNWSWRNGSTCEAMTLFDDRAEAERIMSGANELATTFNPAHDQSSLRVIARPDLQPPPPPTTAKARNEGREHWKTRDRHRHPYAYD
jgi:hypothetical protein